MTHCYTNTTTTTTTTATRISSSLTDAHRWVGKGAVGGFCLWLDPRSRVAGAAATGDRGRVDGGLVYLRLDLRALAVGVSVSALEPSQ